MSDRIRHKKRGTEYVTVGIGRMQAEDWISRTVPHPPVDMREVAIYRSIDDGSLWVRPREEFEDGRFEPVDRPEVKRTPDMLHFAVAAVLGADLEFRASMMPGWDGDPLSDKLNELRHAFEAEYIAPDAYALRVEIGRALDRLICEDSTPKQVDTFIQTFRDFGLAISFVGSPTLSSGVGGGE